MQANWSILTDLIQIKWNLTEQKRSRNIQTHRGTKIHTPNADHYNCNFKNIFTEKNCYMFNTLFYPLYIMFTALLPSTTPGVSNSRPVGQLRPLWGYFVAPTLMWKFNVSMALRFYVNGTLQCCVRSWTDPPIMLGYMALVGGTSTRLDASRETFLNEWKLQQRCVFFLATLRIFLYDVINTAKHDSDTKWN